MTSQPPKITLSQKPQSLEEIFSENEKYMLLLGWTQSQLSLYLHCSSGIHPENGKFVLEDEALNGDLDLCDQVHKLLILAGKPLPLSQLRGKLAAQKIITEPFLRSLIQKDSRFEIKGPLVILV